MIRNKPQIPERTPILSFPTPGGKADMAFFEMRDGSLPKNKEWTYGDSHPDGANFPHHELVFVASDGSDPVWQRWFYAAKRELQHLYNWEYSDTSDWPRITQTFLVKRGDFSPTATFDMPPLEYFPYPAEYSATGLEERPIGDETLASLYVTVVITRERLYKRTVVTTLVQAATTLGSTAITHDSNSNVPEGVQFLEGIGISPGTTRTRVSNTSTTLSIPAYATGTGISVEVVTYPLLAIIGYEFDPDTGSMKPYQRTKVPTGTTGTVIQPNGSFSEIQPASTLWSIKTTKQATGLPGIAVNGVASRTFKMVVQWSWPRVLNYVTIQPVYSDERDIYSAVTGYITTPIFLSEGYSGPCLATIIETWTSKLPKISSEGGSADWDSNSLSTVYPLLEQPSVLLPKAIDFNSPKLNVSVGECLHAPIEFWSGSFYQFYPATSPSRWPASLLASVDLRPYQGGWLKKVMLVDAPTVADMRPEIQVSSSAVSADGFTLNWAATTTPSVLVGNSALSLNVSTDPTFTGASLTGYPMSVLGLTTKVLTGVPQGRNYYCRVTSTKTISGSSTVFTSNILTVVLNPQAQIFVYDGATLIPKTTGTLAFGNVYRGVDSIKTITITNPGLLTLTNLAIAFSGTDGGLFTVVGTLPTFIEAGESINVQVKVNSPSIPAGGGVLAAVATVTSSSSSTPSYDFNISGTVTAAEINVRYSSVSYASGGSIELPGLTVGGNYTDYTFTVENTGAGNLTVSAGITSGDSAWSVLTAPTTPVAGAGSTTLVVRFTPNTDGNSGAVLTLTNNDADENSYVLYLSAEASATGTLQLTNPWGGVQANAGSFNFGTLCVGAVGPPFISPESRNLTFVITNSGVGTLSGLTAEMSGTDAADFTITPLSAALLTAGETTSLTIRYIPISPLGAQSAVLIIRSSDAVTPYYTQTINATALAASAPAAQCQIEQPSGTVLTSGVSSIDFGPQLVTSGTLSKGAKLRNIGNASQTSIDAVFSGTHSADWSDSGLVATLASSANSVGEAEFNLIFNPSGYGPRTASVAVTSNAPTCTINLAGTGVPETPLLTGQAAGVIIGQASATALVTTASSTVTPGAYAVAVSSTGRLAMSCGTDNRILIWNTVPTTSGVAADLVLGQVNFTATGSATTAAGLNTPQGLCWHGANLWVADTFNHRVLRYTNPVANGQAASLVLGQADFTSNTARSVATFATRAFNQPNSVYIYGTKLFVADTFNHRVIIWNAVPTASNTAGSIVLGQPDTTTITSGLTAAKMNNPRAMVVSKKGHLHVVDSTNNRVLRFAGVPTLANTSASFALFQANLTANVSGTTGSLCNSPHAIAVSALGYIAVADLNNHRVLIFYEELTAIGSAHAALGQASLTAGGVAYENSSTNVSYPYGLAWGGTSLIVSSFTMGRAMKFSPAT